jgi:hypothetical protein
MRAADNPADCPVRLLSLAAFALILAVPLSACGNYDPEPVATPGGSGGQAAATGALNPGGASGSEQMSMGGSSPAASGAGGGAPVEVEPVEASCQAVAPCGGDVVGTWIAAGSCLPVSGIADVAGFGLGCTAASVTGMLEVTGTWTANADGTFRDETITSGTSQIEVPAACLNVSGTVTTCDRLGGAFQALGYASVTCANAPSGSGCTCLATVQQAGGLALLTLSPRSSGTYTTGNNRITTSTGMEQQYAYCVSGSAMVVTPPSTGPTGTLTGTIAFVKP